MWSAAQRQKKIYEFDVHAGFEGNHISVGYGKQCSLVWSCVEEIGRSRHEILRFKVKGEAKQDVKSRMWKKEGWFEKERYTLLLKVECQCKQNCCWVEVNLATLTYLEKYLILNIGVSLSLPRIAEKYK